MKKIYICACVILFLFVFSSCGRNNNVEMTTLNFTYAMDVANERRADIIKLDYNDLIVFTYGREQIVHDVVRMAEQMGGEDYILQYMLEFIQPPLEVARYISTQEAIADAETLLFLMRTSYGAYIYYGGDDVFFPLFDRIFETLRTKNEWCTSLTGDFAVLLHTHLSEIITDNHFFINTWPVGAPDRVSSTFFSADVGFYRSKNGFRCQDSNLYVVEVLGYDIDDVFRLAINTAGEFVYVPVITIPGVDRRRFFNLPLVFDNGERKNILVIRQVTERAYNPPSLEWLDGVPVISLQRMYFYPNFPGAREFVTFAHELIDEPVMIVDVRSNLGGSILLSAKFLYILTGEIIPTNKITLGVGNHYEVFNAFHSLPEDYDFYRPLADYMKFQPSKPLGNYSFVWNYTPDRLVDNDRLIILLVDRYTRSGGEGFVDQVLNLKNTLVIGQNTYGVLHKLGGVGLYLPYSGVFVTFGNGIIFFPDDVFSEGTGFAPDVWATGDALEATLAMLKREGIINE